MALTDKYKDVLDYAGTLKIEGVSAQEKDGKLVLTGTAPYQMEKNELWDKIKTHAGWEQEVSADIKVKNTDVYGVYTVVSGDTLGKIAKNLLGKAERYPEIFNLNKDILSSPDVIKPGQTLKLPHK